MAEFNDFVMKQKPLIDADILESKAALIKTNFTEKEHNLLNALLYTLQLKTFSQSAFDFWSDQNTQAFDLMEDQKKSFDRTFTFKENELKKLAGIKDTNAAALSNILESIRTKQIKLKNFTYWKEIEGKSIKIKDTYTGSMILDFVERKMSNSKEKIIQIQLSSLFILLARKDYNIEHGNFALIPYHKTTNTSGFVPKRLIEFISKYDGYEMLLRVNEEQLEKLCNKQPAFSHYKKILNANFKKLIDTVECKIVTWNAKLRFCEIEVEWKIERPGIVKNPFSSLYAFMKHVRKHNVNQILMTISDNEQLVCNDNGMLLNYSTRLIYKTHEATELWKKIFEYHKAKAEENKE